MAEGLDQKLNELLDFESMPVALSEEPDKFQTTPGKVARMSPKGRAG